MHRCIIWEKVSYNYHFLFFAEAADCTTVSGVTFVKSYEIATINFIGQLKVWDLRQRGDKPVRAMLLYVSVLI
jgi:nuclear pore complex protein Nup43